MPGPVKLASRGRYMEAVGQAVGSSRRRAGPPDLPAVAAVRGARQGPRRAEYRRADRYRERIPRESHHRNTATRDLGARGLAPHPHRAAGTRPACGVAHDPDGPARPPPRILSRSGRPRRSGGDRVDLGGLRGRPEPGQGPPGARGGTRRLDAARTDAVVQCRPRRSPRLARHRFGTVGCREPPQLGTARPRARRSRRRHPARRRDPSARPLRPGRRPTPHRFRLELIRPPRIRNP